MRHSTEAPRPTYIPHGYSYGFRIDGEAGPGFIRDPDQTVLIYTRSAVDSTHPLMISLSPSRRLELMATEGHPGLPVALDSGAEAVYHDGLWSSGPGLDERRDGDVVVHWDRSDAHSITVRTEDGVYGVRGARSRGVTVDELLKIANSLPIS
jgi:hypothetical protein